ncbi:SH3 domain-containing protein [Sphingomonas sinipercae]|uniref:SH3 domain-containing protein n=1 Tax=Sphingomonas sinipercae TaxID=2714944 RepID=A0A6G7ZN15_9SPHN|nr:SH3 domain-containing protein [Sphingomonas sinipercae]QIL02286.1 SH3 domain-containing protein [Sphingomonas sinipercae]
MADIALAGQVIASHYAQPLLRSLAANADLMDRPSADGEIVGRLTAGDGFDMLDNTLGWAWGYAGPERRVGYIRADALAG